MPPLPKQHKKKEADFGIMFRKWLETHPMQSAPFEHKHTRGSDRFYYRELKDEQIHKALAAKTAKGSLIRVEKGTIGAGDYAYYSNGPSWIVIKYPQFFVIIDIEAFVKYKDSVKSKSMTSVEALKISHIAVGSPHGAW